MADDKTLNLDDLGEKKYPFILFGHEYYIKEPTIDQMLAFQSMQESDSKDLKKLMDALSEFVEPKNLGANTPEFKDISGRMTIAKMNRFADTVFKELFGIDTKKVEDGNNQSTEDTP